VTGDPQTADPPRPASLGRTTPLAEDRYEVRFTASAATCRKLRQAQDLPRRTDMNGNLADVVDRAVTLLLAELARTRFAATKRPLASGASPGVACSSSASRHIPAAVRRTVWLRDGARCAFVGGGRRCSGTTFLEFHHVQAYATGGPATSENIQLRCRAHNQYEADLLFGAIATARGVDVSRGGIATVRAAERQDACDSGPPMCQTR
jgi:hypothetical protein